MNKKIMTVSILITILFVSAIAGNISYYNIVVRTKDSQIASLNKQIANLTSQVSNLTAQAANLTFLTSANLVTSLGVTEASKTVPKIGGVDFSLPYNQLIISGTVTNSGKGTAFNVGLHVVAYTATGALEINRTYPLGGTYGSDNATDAYTSGDYYSPPVNLGSGQMAMLYPPPANNGPYTEELTIFHEGVVSNWTITPVWTNIS
jgi:hypothetical protein